MISSGERSPVEEPPAIFPAGKHREFICLIGPFELPFGFRSRRCFIIYHFSIKTILNTTADIYCEFLRWLNVSGSSEDEIVMDVAATVAAAEPPIGVMKLDGAPAAVVESLNIAISESNANAADEVPLATIEGSAATDASIAAGTLEASEAAVAATNELVEEKEADAAAGTIESGASADDTIVTTETPVEAVAESPVEAIVTAVSEAPVEAVVEASVEAVAEVPVEAVVEAPVEAVSAEPVEAIVEAIAEAVAETPAEAVSEKPAEVAAEAPVEAVAEALVAAAAEPAAESTVSAETDKKSDAKEETEEPEWEDILGSGTLMKKTVIKSDEGERPTVGQVVSIMTEGAYKSYASLIRIK